MRSTLQVRHNIEVAHRLSLLPGKCENIHGHSMWIALEMCGAVDAAGLLGGMEFGAVKRAFRGHLDEWYDHRLLLNAEDPLAGLDLPGTRLCAADPTTEHIARWIAEWASGTWPQVGGLRVVVNETHVNAASSEVGW